MLESAAYRVLSRAAHLALSRIELELRGIGERGGHRAAVAVGERGAGRASIRSGVILDRIKFPAVFNSAWWRLVTITAA